MCLKCFDVWIHEKLNISDGLLIKVIKLLYSWNTWKVKICAKASRMIINGMLM